MRALRVRRRVHFRRAERHDRFAGGQKPPREVTGPSRARCYNRGWASTRRRTEEDRAADGVGLRRLVRPSRPVGTVVSAR